MPTAKPTRAEIAAAAGKTLPDIIAPNLRVLFCGFNPGLYSGATGRHFARPGNRFWPTLYAAGLTDRLLAPHEDRELLRFGIGVTNLVDRATATADMLSREELVHGGRRLVMKCRRFRPQNVVVLGVTAFRAAFENAEAVVGRQPERIGDSVLWILPNTSGLNAHFPPARLAEVFRAFRDEITAA